MITYISGGTELVDVIEPLWNKLRIHHSKISIYFGKEMSKVSYDKRKLSFFQEGKNICIVIAKYGDRDIGYIAASFVDKKGEIESIYVDDDYRGQSVGHTLMQKSMDYFSVNNISDIAIYVAVGNEKAYEFYSDFGFYPRVTKLVRK